MTDNILGPAIPPTPSSLEATAADAQKDWIAPSKLPLSERQWLVSFLKSSHPGSDAQLLEERYGNHHASRQKTAAAESPGIDVVDLLSNRSGQARGDAANLLLLGEFPAWSLEFAALLLHGYRLEEASGRAAIIKLKRDINPSDEGGRVLATYERLRREFSPEYEAAPNEIIHVVSMWEPIARPPMPFYLWQTTLNVARELARLKRNAVWWAERRDALCNHKKRVRKDSLARRAEALVWILASEQWPKQKGNASALAKLLRTLTAATITNADIPTKERAGLTATLETFVSVLERGAAHLGTAPSDGKIGPKENKKIS